MNKTLAAFVLSIFLISSAEAIQFYQTPSDLSTFEIISIPTANAWVRSTAEVAFIGYDIIARGGDVKWAISSTEATRYITIKQDMCEFPPLPVFYPKSTLWFFTSATAGASVEVKRDTVKPSGY